MTRRSALGLTAALALSLLVAPAPVGLDRAEAGDAKVAETLFKSGKQALGKGDCAGAITFFNKAFEESSELIESVWWRGSAQEKSGDKPAALTSYREFLGLYQSKYASGATMSKEELRLKALADKSVDSLAAGEKELKKLEDGYVAALFAFAKDNFVRDPGVSLRAVEALLAVRPEHEDALKLQEKLGGAAPEGAKSDAPAAAGSTPAAFRAVKEWKDFLADKTFSASDTITYEGNLMVVDAKDGKKVMPGDSVDQGKSFAYEVQYRVTQTHDRGWGHGLVFGQKRGEWMVLMAQVGQVVLVRHGADESEVATYDMPPIKTGDWHRLGVIVKGPSIEAWFDGKKVISWMDPSGADHDGELGFTHQRCRMERNVFRAGRLD